MTFTEGRGVIVIGSGPCSFVLGGGPVDLLRIGNTGSYAVRLGSVDGDRGVPN